MNQADQIAPRAANTGTSSRSSIAKSAAGKDKPDKPYEVRADNPQGLLLRVQPSGARTYYVQVGRGKRIRIGQAGTFTLEQAKVRARALILDPSIAAKTASDRLTLKEFIEGPYKDHASARLKNGAASVARVLAAWKPLLKQPMSDIKTTDVERLRTKRLNTGVAPATVNRDVAALSGVFSFWVANTKGAAHPLTALAALKVSDDETIRYLSPDESARLRAALAQRDTAAAAQRNSANAWRAERGYEPLPDIAGYSDHLTPMVLLSLNTGLRQGELFSLAWSDVDLQHKSLSVLASNSKGNKTRVIPLNAEAMTVLTAIRPKAASGLVFKSPVSGERFDNVKKAWAELTKAADLPDLRWHDLRHDFASHLVMKGAALFTVQKLLGHSNSKMTQRYARLAPSTLADAVNLLSS
jgi:integrase